MSMVNPYLALRKRTALKITPRLSFVERIDWLSANVGGTVGYYVTRAAAIGLLESRLIESVADHWIFLAPNAGARFFVSCPAVVYHPPNETESDIAHARMEHIRAMRTKDRAGIVRPWMRWFYYGVRRRIGRHVVMPIAERIL
jgi:hypothetical protein